MDRVEQQALVKGLTQTLYDLLRTHFVNGTIPKEWDGHELRELVFLAAKEARSSHLKGKRKKDFNNYCLVNNLP